MLIKYTAEELNKFEIEIAEIYKTGIIKAPVHLRMGLGYAESMIDLFKRIDEQDYIFSYWASHIPCLLKGVPIDELKQAILDGKSISLCFPKYRIFCSGIVGSLMGAAVGCAYSIKKRMSNTRVWHFCGDMAAECGIFHEATKYADNWDLPIDFIIEDNGISVMTDTKSVWRQQEPQYKPKWNIFHFRYKNQFPHSGVVEKIKF